MTIKKYTEVVDFYFGRWYNPYELGRVCMSEKLKQKILKLKEERNAVILVHVYQRGEIQEIGDFVGDSLGLCVEAAKTDADVIVFCGVHFMAESAKLLNPNKTVLLPRMDAGCPMADMATADKLRTMKEENPNAVVVTYVNSTADVKAESDICCTSSNAVKVVNSIPEDKDIIFVPDKHLGSYVAEKTGRDIKLWPGFCPTHQRILPEYIAKLKEEHPEAYVLVHPESPKETRDTADFIGSTEQIFQECLKSDKKVFIIGTEEGILYRLKKHCPDKTFIHATKLAECKNMKKIKLEHVLASLENMTPEVDMDGPLIEKALKPLKRMMELQ